MLPAIRDCRRHQRFRTAACGVLALPGMFVAPCTYVRAAKRAGEFAARFVKRGNPAGDTNEVSVGHIVNAECFGRLCGQLRHQRGWENRLQQRAECRCRQSESGHCDDGAKDTQRGDERAKQQRYEGGL